MANTEITISNSGGVLIGSQPSVTVSEGDTVTFSIGSGQAFLFFSPGAAAVLSPSPKGPVPVGPSAEATFTFTTSQPGAYSLFFGTDASFAPPNFQGGESSQLWFEIIAPDVIAPEPPVEASPVINFGGPSAGPRDAG
jgi:hypothetical protein